VKVEKSSEEGELKGVVASTKSLERPKLRRRHGNGDGDTERETSDSSLLGPDKIVFSQKTNKNCKRSSTRGRERVVQSAEVSKPLKFRIGRYHMISPPKKLMPRDEPVVSNFKMYYLGV
jgi:hypothetical protein